MTELRRTALHDLHRALGAKMVPFAGWDMPVQYPLGIMAEHLHVRAHAGLFDVSHMGQVILRPASAEGGRRPPSVPDSPRDISVQKMLETLVPADLEGLAEGRQRYGIFTTPEGGILDDLMIANRGDHLYLVVNAACVDQDLAHLRELAGIEVVHVTDRALLALQGPQAEVALARLVPGVTAMRFMDMAGFDWNGANLWVSRSGYTGEDGFEISLPADRAAEFAEALLAMAEVAPIGLGARDSLRLEAGLPLYGHDMDQTTTPAAAGLGWSIPKLRRSGGAREGGFPGAGRILPELADGPAMRRRGVIPEGRAPIREGVPLYAVTEGGIPIGTVSSGGFGPTLGGPMAMAILPVDLPDGATIFAELRGKRVPARLTALPFVPHSYKR